MSTYGLLIPGGMGMPEPKDRVVSQRHPMAHEERKCSTCLKSYLLGQEMLSIVETGNPKAKGRKLKQVICRSCLPAAKPSSIDEILAILPATTSDDTGPPATTVVAS